MVTRRLLKLVSGSWPSVWLLALGILLQGCSSDQSISGLATAPEVKSTLPAAQGLRPIDAKVALSPLTGPPQAVADQIVRKLDTAAMRSRLALMTDADAVGDYRLQGYLVATKTRQGIDLSYIWDVFDSRGARLGRTSGNETIAGAPAGRDVWSIIPQSVFQSIAEKGIAAVAKRVQAAAPPTALAPQAGLRR